MRTAAWLKERMRPEGSRAMTGMPALRTADWKKSGEGRGAG
jgi:hypothetical protein